MHRGCYMNLTNQIGAILLAGVVLPGQGENPRSRQVEFFKEEITMAITDSTSSISGAYYFRNNTEKDKPYAVVFPFYVDGVSHYPHEIRAYTVDDGDTLVIEPARLEGRNAVRLRIPMRPEDVTIWHLDYTQRIESDYARYILTSTEAWGQPLEEATYRFLIPADYRIIEIWPKVDKARRLESTIEMWCEKINFMPDQDMRIFWDRE